MLQKNKYSVVINAGGLGTRLSSEYNGLPKALVPVFDDPIIIDQINKFFFQGFEDFVVLLGHKALEIQLAIETYYSQSRINILFLTETEPLGSGGSLLHFIHHLPESFIFTYCDILFDLNINNMVEFHEDLCADLTVFVHPNDHPYDSDLVVVETSGLVSAIKPHPHSFDSYTGNLVNAAFYVVNKKCLLQIDYTGGAMDFAQNIITEILFKSKVCAYKTPEFLKDIGTPYRISKARTGYENRFRSDGNNKVICFDRDGTINKCIEGEYITSVDGFKLIEGVSEAVEALRNLGFFLVCVTNQPVIARGDISLDDLRAIHLKMDWLLGTKNAYLDEIYFCPHHTDSGYQGEIVELKFECECRKPKTGLLKQVERDIPFDRQRSWFVGDSWRDIQCGKSFKMSTCSIGEKELGADVKVPNLFEFIEKLKLMQDDQ